MHILQESFAMTYKSHPPPCRNDLQPLYLSVTLYACAQRAKVQCISTGPGSLSKSLATTNIHEYRYITDHRSLSRLSLELLRS